MSVAVGERRIVSVLIADVADSTPIGEKLGPERSKFLFDDVVRLMRDEVERFGGTVAQLTGDGVLALFGAPTAHEDDSERAVCAALAIHEALDAYGTRRPPLVGRGDALAARRPAARVRARRRRAPAHPPQRRRSPASRSRASTWSST